MDKENDGNKGQTMGDSDSSSAKTQTSKDDWCVGIDLPDGRHGVWHNGFSPVPYFSRDAVEEVKRKLQAGETVDSKTILNMALALSSERCMRGAFLSLVEMALSGSGFDLLAARARILEVARGQMSAMVEGKW